MNITDEQREFAMEMLTAMLIEDRAEQERRTYKELFREFRKSKTMRMLFDAGTGLWMNGPVYINDEWEKEQGLNEKLLAEIRELAEHHGIEKVILFGSRARGDHGRKSDIDLAVSGGNINAFALDLEEETSTLLRFDCINLDGAVNPELMDSIEKEGKTIYEKN